MRGVLIWLLICLAAWPGPAAARGDDGEDEICISIGQLWFGNGNDARAIETTPVPDSYRRRFEATGCERYWLVKDSLIDWHVRFGSEQSTRRAIDYIAQDYTRRAGPPERFLPALQRAWQGAQADLRRAATIKQPPGVNYSAQGLFVSKSATIQRFRRMLVARESYRDLAELNLRGAEWFASVAMLDEAERYLGAVVSSEAFLAPLENQPPTQRVIYFNLHPFLSDDLRMRAAVLRAALLPSPKALADAEAALKSIEQPEDRQFARSAFSDGNSFCDMGREDLRAKCNARGDSPHVRVIGFTVARATLDLLSANDAPDAPRSFYAADALLAAEGRSERPRCCKRRVEEDRTRLYLAAAQHHRRGFEGALANAKLFEARLHWGRALNNYRLAAGLAAPFDAPVPFRATAQAWLDLWRRGDVLEEPGRETRSAQDERYAAYLRAILPNMDAIATGTPTRVAAPN